MAIYGEKVDYDYNPEKEKIYSIFVDYFQNPKMTKIKDVENYSMYMTKINCMLGIEFRYLIAFTDKNTFSKGDEKFLSQLNWVSLQTRSLEDEHKLPSHNYIPRRLTSLDKKITLKRKDEKQYIYDVEDLPLQIILLSKSKNIDYNASGSVVNALETYQTLINFI